MLGNDTSCVRVEAHSGDTCHVRVVLHSSEMAVGMYERAGFTRQCEMPVYANAALWASRAS